MEVTICSSKEIYLIIQLVMYGGIKRFSLLRFYCLHLDLWTDLHRSFVLLEDEMEL